MCVRVSVNLLLYIFIYYKIILFISIQYWCNYILLLTNYCKLFSLSVVSYWYVLVTSSHATSISMNHLEFFLYFVAILKWATPFFIGDKLC